jgi:hypothetical protein
MKRTMSSKRKGSDRDHPVDRVFGRLSLRKTVDAIIDQLRGPRPIQRREKASTQPR